MSRRSYRIAGLGGTFDHFHAGHAHFLRFASQQATHLRIGVTDQKLTQFKTYSQLIQQHAARVRAVSTFCNQEGISFEIIQLSDAFGPTLEETTIEALIVTEATMMGAKAINDLRDKLKLRELPVHVASMLKTSTGETLSSTLVRAGTCDRNGRVYTDVIKNDLTLTAEQKSFFSLPQAKTMGNKPIFPQSGITCVVGDASLEKFLYQKWEYDLGVFDGKTQRKTVHHENISKITPTHTASNPPGKISLQLIKVLEKINFLETNNLLVEGEEDLVTVALVLILPLTSVIYYGQPDKGMVELKVTEELKQRFFDHLATV